MLSELKALIGLILSESRKDDVKKQFPDMDVDSLAAGDPSGTFKYLQWMAKQVKSGAKPDLVKELVGQFHKAHARMPKKDINQYSVDTLTAALKDVPTTSKREDRSAAKEGGHSIYEDDDISVYFMETPEACQLYGKGSKWCITGAGADGPAAWSQYKGDHERDTQFYFVFRKKPLGDEFDKIAIDFPTAETEEPSDGWNQGHDEDDRPDRPAPPEPDFYDALDNTRAEKEITKVIPSFKQALAAIKKDADKRPNEESRILAKYKTGYWDKVGVIQRMGQRLPDHELKTLLARIEKDNYTTREKLAKYVAELPPGDFKSRLWNEFSRESKSTFANLFVSDPNPEISKAAKIAVIQHLSRGYGSAETIASFSKDSDPEVRAAVAGSIRVRAEILLTLAEDPEPTVRAATISPMRYQGSLDANYIQKFLYDKDSIVRAALADAFAHATKKENHLDPQLLHILANDESHLVRRAVSRDKSLSIEDLTRLAKDPDTEVRSHIAWNDATPDEIREEMMNDPDFGVQNSAKSAQKHFTKERERLKAYRGR